MKVSIDSIIVKDGRRDINYDKVTEIAESIKEIGLLNPIIINNDNFLIAGNHRLEAYKQLGFTEIEVNIRTFEEAKKELLEELAEIDENLIRYELHFVDSSDQLKRRKEIYEVLNPETIARNKKGHISNYKSSESDSDPEPKPSFVTDTSIKTGKSKTVIKEELKIANDIIPEVKEVIKEKDITKTDALKIARLEPDQQKKVADKFVNDNAKSYVDANRMIKKEEVHEVPEIEGKYRIIYADPPWNYGNKLVEGYGAAENHYPSMTIQELCDMPVQELTEDNAVLFLWVTSPLLEECFPIIKAWGFKYKTSFVWDKIKHNMGHYNSVRHEILLICTKGSCLPDNNKLFDSVQSIERSNKHSEKPQEFREIIETLYIHGNKIELFSRKQVEGWSVWGNQT